MNWVIKRINSKENDSTVVQGDQKVPVHLIFFIVIIKCTETF